MASPWLGALRAIAAALLLAAPAPLAADESRPLWLAVTTPQLAEALGPLAQLRRSQGLDVLISTDPPAQAIARAPRRPKCLLLVGDDQAGCETQPWFVGSGRIQRYRWRAEQAKEFASDVAIADSNADAMPEFSVGRIPARTRQEAAAIVGKIIRYESMPPPAEPRLVAWLGAPMYGPAVDALATNLALATLTAHAPDWLGAWIVSADPQHRLCGRPAEQSSAFARHLREAALGVFIGHGSVLSIVSMRRGDEMVGLPASGVPTLFDGLEPCPPVVLLACHCGNFSSNSTSLAEALLSQPGGPVAVMAATTESHPLTNYYSAVGLLDQLHRSPPRLSTLWFGAQVRARTLHHPMVDALLLEVEGKLGNLIDQASLRRDQLLMYALLGDPATVLKLPQPMPLEVRRQTDGWHWRASPPAGSHVVHVGLRTQAPRFEPLDGSADDDARRAAMEQANAQLDFSPVEHPVAGACEGVVAQPGILRVVARSPDGATHVGTARLIGSTSAPAEQGGMAEALP